jgi:predicted NBD/HSP70 family sugar kinase
MDICCGIDWAEDHHDVAIVDRDGRLLARRRISDDAAGLAALLSLLAEHDDSADDPIPVAIETPRGAPSPLPSNAQRHLRMRPDCHVR